MRVFLSAGEPSGDHHAALLVRALKARRPDVECVGLGGPCMEAEGCMLVADMTTLAAGDARVTVVLEARERAVSQS